MFLINEVTLNVETNRVPTASLRHRQEDAKHKITNIPIREHHVGQVGFS